MAGSKKDQIASGRIELLNFLLPGNAPILVPNGNKRGHTATPIDDAYDADIDEETGSKRTVSKKVQEARHKRRKARSHQRKLYEREQQRIAHEKAEEVAALEKQKKDQESYFYKLQLLYAQCMKAILQDKSYAAPKKMEPSDFGDDESGPDAAPPNYGSTTAVDGTDDSTVIAQWFRNLKISAAGTDGAHANDVTWTLSEDSQLMALKNGNESWKKIAEIMNRSKNEVQRRYKALQKMGFTIPGAEDDVQTDAAVVDEDVTNNDAASAPMATVTAGPSTDADMTNASALFANSSDVEFGKENDGIAASLFARMAGSAQMEAAQQEIPTQSHVPQVMAAQPIQSSSQEMPQSENGKGEHQQDYMQPAQFTDGQIKDQQGYQLTNNQVEQQNYMQPTQFTNKQAEQQNFMQPQQSTNDHFFQHGYQFTNGQAQQQHAYMQPGHSANSLAQQDQAETDNTIGIRAYLGQYAQQLIADKHAHIPATDKWFDQDDCILLSLVDRHRTERRWLDIQQDFANMTGRLVPVEVLMWKLDGGARPDGLE